MKEIPKNCSRCGVEIDMENGEPCYQRDCNFYKKKKTSLVEEIIDFRQDMKDAKEEMEKEFEKSQGILNILSTKADDANSTKDNNGENEAAEDSQDSDDTAGDDDGESLLEEASSGCIGGFLKLIWQIVTFPFRMIYKIFTFLFGD